MIRDLVAQEVVSKGVGEPVADQLPASLFQSGDDMKKKVKEEEIEKAVVVKKGNRVELGLAQRNAIMTRVAQSIGIGKRYGY